MRLFISWSGGRSHRLAVAMKEWLEDYFPSEITVFVSSEIEKGSQWFPAVEGQMRDADAGLVCLTPESLSSAWITFEAGALATAVALNKGQARIFTYLLDVSPASLPGPLAAYQSTVATMEDTLRLVNGLLSFLEVGPIDVAAFADRWADLQKKLDAIGPEPVTTVFPQMSALFRRKTYEEPVDQCMDQSWFRRYDGAMATYDALRRRDDVVTAECGETAAQMFRELLIQVDGYAMGMSALLFCPRKFDLTDEGRLNIPPGIRNALERRRTAILALIAQLTDARQQPVMPDAFLFEHTASLAEKKSMIHRVEQQPGIAGDRPTADPDTVMRLANSDWTLDRIAAYLMGERSQPDPYRAVEATRHELELFLVAENPNMVGLQHGLRWIRAAVRANPSNASDVQGFVGELRETLDKHQVETTGEVRTLLSEIEGLVKAPD